MYISSRDLILIRGDFIEAYIRRGGFSLYRRSRIGGVPVHYENVVAYTVGRTFVVRERGAFEDSVELSLTTAVRVVGRPWQEKQEEAGANNSSSSSSSSSAPAADSPHAPRGSSLAPGRCGHVAGGYHGRVCTRAIALDRLTTRHICSVRKGRRQFFYFLKPLHAHLQNIVKEH